MKRAYENGPGKNWGLGALQTSKTSFACRREHDSVVLLDSRKSLILDGFWSSILETLGPSCAENTIFWVSENHFIFSSIFILFWYPKMVLKINEKSILSVILRQHGFKEVSS